MKKLPVAINDEEFVSLINATKMRHHRIAFLLGYGSGLRLSEVVHLESRDVDINAKTILVRQGKGKKDRIVPLPKGFKQEHLSLLPIKAGPRALERAFKRAAKKSRLTMTKPEIHFHSLRHGFASNAVAKGIPIHHVRTLMGHSNISTTNVYLEMNPKDALKSYEDMF